MAVLEGKAGDAAEALNAKLGRWGKTQPPNSPADDEKLWGLIANLLGLIFIIGPLVAMLVKGSSPYVKFHAVQMIGWQIVMFGVSLMLGVVFSILGAVPIVAHVASALFGLIGLGCLLLLLYMALLAHKGTLFRLPFIGPFAMKTAYGA